MRFLSKNDRLILRTSRYARGTQPATAGAQSSFRQIVVAPPTAVKHPAPESTVAACIPRPGRSLTNPEAGCNRRSLHLCCEGYGAMEASVSQSARITHELAGPGEGRTWFLICPPGTARFPISSAADH